MGLNVKKIYILNVTDFKGLHLSEKISDITRIGWVVTLIENV